MLFITSENKWRTIPIADFNTLGISFDVDAAIAIGSQRMAKLTISQNTAIWERIDVQPTGQIESIDNEFIDNLN